MVHKLRLRNGFRRKALLASAFLFLATAAFACQVPVFRYALERWSPDHYQLVLLHVSPLDGTAADLGQQLSEGTHPICEAANFSFRSLQLDGTEDPYLRELLDKHLTEDQSPLLLMVYPQQAVLVPDPVVDVAPFTEEALQAIVDSPARQEVVKRIATGESAVWLFLPSGDEAQDEPALSLLREEVQKNAERLELPVAEIEADEFFQQDTAIELKIGFSVLPLQRNDPQEKFLVEMLLGSESDLRDLKEPMAFPVFGRGRVLYALIGKGINADNVAEASSFITGPCSCQVKEQNPGFDLCLSTGWDELISGSAIPQREIPELTSLAALDPGETVASISASKPDARPAGPTSLVDPAADPANRSAPVVESKSSGALSRNLLLTLAVSSLLVVLATVLFYRRSE